MGRPEVKTFRSVSEYEAKILKEIRGRILPLCGLELTTKKCQTHYRVSGKSQWSLSYAFHPLHCCTISWKRVTCHFTEQVGVVTTLLALFWTYLVQMLVGLPPVLRTAAPFVVIFLSLQLNGGLCLTTSDEWLHRNPSLINLVTEFLFYALCFTRFCCNASCQFTPLLYLRSPVDGLMLLNICTFQSPAISWPTVGMAA